MIRQTIIAGEYGRSPRGSFLWITASISRKSSSPTTSITKNARWPFGSHSRGDGGSRYDCSGIHGLYCLLTHPRDHDRRHLSILDHLPGGLWPRDRPLTSTSYKLLANDAARLGSSFRPGDAHAP